jgi:hypothetical protein
MNRFLGTALKGKQHDKPNHHAIGSQDRKPTQHSSQKDNAPNLRTPCKSSFGTQPRHNRQNRSLPQSHGSTGNYRSTE